METDPARLCERPVGLEDVDVLGVITDFGPETAAVLAPKLPVCRRPRRPQPRARARSRRVVIERQLRVVPATPSLRTPAASLERPVPKGRCR